MPTTAPSTVPAFLDALKTALDARAGLDGVEVATAPQGSGTRNESIQVHDVTQGEEWALLGARTADETYAVALTVWVVKPGAGEALAKTARDRAYTLMAEVAAALRENPHMGGDSIKVAAMSSADLDQGVNPNGRWAQLTFEVQVEARLSYVA